MEKVLSLRLKSPFSGTVLPSGQTWRVTGWSASGKTNLIGSKSFTIGMEEGKVGLMPYKIILVGKNHITIEPLSSSDIRYASSLFVKLSGTDGSLLVLPSPAAD